MVFKEEVLSWFKELESYRRIDVLCSLLNMCLPFELRFAGTYVEELGKRDFQELRGAELRANNPDELAAEMSAGGGGGGGGAGACHGDPRAPRRMALYVSLLRSCNAACARTLHAALLGLERAGLLRQEPLEELLLLYTMALHHPAFTFDQRDHYGDVLSRLKASQAPPPPQPGPSRPHPPQHQQHQQPLQRVRYVLVKGSPEQPGEMMPAMVGALPPPPSGETMIPAMHEGGAPQPPGPQFAVAQYGVVDYGIPPQPHWPEAVIQEAIPPEVFNFAAQPSPFMSQPTSPCDSRPVSPNVQVPPPTLISAAVRAPSRQNQDPAAMPIPHDQIHLQQQQIATNFGNLSIGEIRQMEDERLTELGFPPRAVTQLRSIEKLNGMQRSPHGPKPPATTYLYTQSHHIASSESDTGSSTGSRSPPETPALPPGPGRPRQPTSPLYLQQQQPPQQPYVQQQHYPRYPSYPAAYRPNYPPFAANGETPMYSAQYSTTYVPVQIYAQPKLSCWNCGSTGHSGNDCKEPSIEEVVRPGTYQLDYSTAPPDINDK